MIVGWEGSVDDITLEIDLKSASTKSFRMTSRTIGHPEFVFSEWVERGSKLDLPEI